ncbi:hypothetical protein N657DRAFT_668058 [Parathielavia appendiculata]|uniref:Uncharacterized protein n=1 Tax=Parathielavia appendiculata TaxID=2587402 RepID=A0AAN6Z968_9PEZI|nr:hypothetical protein N657DRAFT_668058 [Parathielavia appendiculata]
MSGPGSRFGPGGHYHRQHGAYTTDTSYMQSATAPQRSALARSGSSQAGIPQRKGTVVTVGTVSSGDKFTVSPASSIHEDDGEARGYGAPAGLSPSPPRQDRADRAPGWVGWEGQTRPWHGPAQADETGGDMAPSLWQTGSVRDEIPYPQPQHWRGSRDMEELQEARARALESSRSTVGTPYARGLVRAAVSASPAPGLNAAENEITPAPAAPSYLRWQSQQQQSQAASQPSSGRAQGQAVQSNRRGPFMHYEDLDYFGPQPESEPKDGSQVDIGVPRGDTFPPIPEEMNRPKVRRSWDRQRRRRRKKMESGNGDGHGGQGGGGGRGGGRGGGALLRSCIDWLPEVACCFLSIVCLVVIVVVLKTYDGRGLADWPLTVSLNTLIAFLAAICQVALIVPLTEGLSQLKWNSFARGEKPLADFQTFEDAKRGPVGSAMLLCRRRGRALGMTAATALLTGFLLSPLTQGAITYPTRSFEAGSGTAAVARSESYSHPTPYDNLDTREKQAIHSGIYHPVDEEVPPLQPLCSTGNCQWQNFSSLAVCSAVADVSDRLAVSNQVTILGGSLGGANNELAREARLPNGLFLVGSTTTYNLNVSWPLGSSSTSGGANETDGRESFLPARTSIAFPERDGRISSAIANFFLVYTSQTGELASDSQQLGVFRAAEVLLHFCVNTYEASTTGGVSTSKVVHLSTLATEDEASNALVRAREASSSSRRVRLRAAGVKEVYSVERGDVKLLNNYILSLFSGTYSYRYGKSTAGETAISEALGLAMFGSAPLDDDGMRDVVQNLTTNVAISLTNTIRAMSSASAKGTVLSRETYVHVQWGWLTFLAVQVALVVSFLLGIMVQTTVWDVKTVKGSIVASLLALSADDKAYLQEQENVFLDSSRNGCLGDEVTDKLQTITARFRPCDRGWALELGKRENG